MSGRRRLMMGVGSVETELILEMGLDSRMRFRLSGRTLIADNNAWNWGWGGIGTHYDLERNYPNLYFGSHKCYANGKIWDLHEPLRLDFAPARIANVELLECGRTDVSVGEAHGRCYITWTDSYFDMVDDAISSSRYLIKITFE